MWLTLSIYFGLNVWIGVNAMWQGIVREGDRVEPVVLLVMILLFCLFGLPIAAWCLVNKGDDQ